MNQPYIDNQGRLDLEAFQADVVRWAGENFPGEDFGELDPLLPFLGMVEEVGELAHALLKAIQGIRGQGDDEVRRARAIDAVGDLFVFAARFANKMDFSLEWALMSTWAEVRRRNWKDYPETGHPPITAVSDPEG